MLSDVESTLRELLPAQRQAVTYPGARMLVLGAAGTGKTRVIEARVAWLVEQGSPPQRLAVVVPTAARAHALQARLEEALRPGYEELFVLTPPQLAAVILGGVPAGEEALDPTLAAGERLAMLLERVDELSLARHDIGGNLAGLLAGFVRRIDRLKAESIDAGRYAAWAAGLERAGADPAEAALQGEFAEVYRTHERMLAETAARDTGDLIRDALRALRGRPALAARFAHVLVDDAQELDLAPAMLVSEAATGGLTVAGDPHNALRRFRGAGRERLKRWREEASHVVVLRESLRCGRSVLAGAAVLIKHAMRTALCGEVFERAFAAAGAPEALVTAVHAGHDVCAQIIARPEIGFVSFTGSVRGGHEVYREASR